MYTLLRDRTTLNVVGDIFSEEDLCERTAEGLLDFLLTLRDKDILFAVSEKLTQGLGAVASKFIESKHICTKVLMVFTNTRMNEESKPNKIQSIHFWL